MTWSDFLFELLKEERDKGIIEVLKRVDKDRNSPLEVKPEDCVLTDEEFNEFMEKNQHLIFEK